MYILRWFLILLVLLYVLDALYTWVYKNALPRTKVSYLLSIQEEKIDYVFLGSSRTNNFIDSKIITEITGKKALNLGIQGAKMDDYYLMLQLLKKQRINTDLIFVQIDDVFNMRGSSDLVKSSLMPYIQDSLIARYVRERDSDFWKLKHLPFYRYMVYDYKLGFREFFSNLIQKKPRVDLSNGYAPKYGTVEDLKAKLPKQIASKNDVVKAMRSFAKKNNTQLIFFTSPYCGHTKNLFFIDSLQEKISPLMNYAEIFAHDDQYFYNCTHLNNKGAQVFSKRIAEDIVSKYQN